MVVGVPFASEGDWVMLDGSSKSGPSLQARHWLMACCNRWLVPGLGPQIFFAIPTHYQSSPSCLLSMAAF